MVILSRFYQANNNDHKFNHLLSSHYLNSGGSEIKIRKHVSYFEPMKLQVSERLMNTAAVYVYHCKKHTVKMTMSAGYCSFRALEQVS